jgi:hypothetical protein
MADTKATNQKKAIITDSVPNEQLAETPSPLNYLQKGDKAPPKPSLNHIETWKCDASQKCAKTKIGDALIIHHESKIGIPFGGKPSWYASSDEKAGDPPVGKGTKGLQVQYFAKSATHSPDVVVEGKWAVREEDKTEQDNNNGPGHFVYKKALTEVPDDSDLLFMQCSVSALKLVCGHLTEDPEHPDKKGEERFIVIRAEAKPKDDDVFDVFLYDVVTLTATRVNAAETDPAKQKKINCHFALYKEKRKPPKEETKHAALVISRDLSPAIPCIHDGWEKLSNVTLMGTDTTLDGWPATEFKIGEQFLLKSPDAGHWQAPKAGSTEKSEKALKDAQAQSRESARTSLQSNMGAGQAQRNYDLAPSDKNAGAVVSAKQKQDAAADAHESDRVAVAKAQRTAAVDRVAKVGKSAKVLVDTWNALMGFINWAPLTLRVGSHGCSGGPSCTIRAFPPGQVKVNLWNLKDVPFLTPLKALKEAAESLKEWMKFIKGAKIIGHGVPDEEGSLDPENPAGFSLDWYLLTRDQKTASSNKIKGPNAPADPNKKVVDREAEELEPKIEIAAEWKELTEDKNGFKHSMVRRAYSLEIAIEKLLGVEFHYEIPILKMSFLGAVATLCEKFGIKVGPYFIFDVGLGIGLAAKFVCDEYDSWNDSGGEMTLAAKFKIAVCIKIGKVAEVGAKVEGEWTPKVALKRNKTNQICVKREKSVFTIRSVLYANVDLGIWSGKWEAEMGKWPFNLCEAEIVVFGAK